MATTPNRDEIKTEYALMRRGTGVHRMLIVCAACKNKVDDGERYYMAATTQNGKSIGLAWHEHHAPDSVKLATMGYSRN